MLYRTDPQGREEDLSISLPRSANIDAWQALANHFIACILDDETCSHPCGMDFNYSECSSDVAKRRIRTRGHPRVCGVIDLRADRFQC
tara:strand:- start:343 stop:606 length:264 start_codon:yes stop_codon:yes gene_type:complete